MSYKDWELAKDFQLPEKFLVTVILENGQKCSLSVVEYVDWHNANVEDSTTSFSFKTHSLEANALLFYVNQKTSGTLWTNVAAILVTKQDSKGHSKLAAEITGNFSVMVNDSNDDSKGHEIYEAYKEHAVVHLSQVPGFPFAVRTYTDSTAEVFVTKGTS